MAEENAGANNGQAGSLPPASPSGEQPNPNGTMDPNPATPNPENPEPFHKDEQTQYIIRQVTKNLADLMAQMNRPAASSAFNPAVTLSEDDTEVLVKEMMQDHQLDESNARKLVAKMKKANASKLKSLEDDVLGMKLAMRFSSVYRNPDAPQYEAQMRKIFEGMNDLEKNFVLNSPDGPQFLYEKAKKAVNGGFVPPSQKISGSVARGGAVPPAQKLNPREVQINEITKALRSGDAKGYEEKIQALTRG